ncbi:hypothetical protein ACFL2P_00735 [Candidatus Moduliflexota bacterium]
MKVPEVRKGRTGRTAIAAVLMAALFAGCAGGSIGRLEKRTAVLNDFMAGKVLPGYTYYTTGMENNPDAILGIRDGITLRTTRWLEREGITPKLLRRMVGEMNSTFGAASAGLLGTVVLNEQGEEVGVWYSAISITVVKTVGPSEITVAPPNPTEIEKLQQSRGR